MAAVEQPQQKSEMYVGCETPRKWSMKASSEAVPLHYDRREVKNQLVNHDTRAHIVHNIHMAILSILIPES